MQKMEFIFTLIFFLCGAIACLLGPAFHLQWVGPIFVFTFALVYLLASRPPANRLKLMLCILVIGYTVDSLLKLFGLLTFVATDWSLGQIPLWFFCFWVLFAVSFPTLFGQVKNYWLAFFIGFIGGPLYYFTGWKLGVLHFHTMIYLSLLSISIAWALMLCVFVKLMQSLTHPQSTIKSNH